MLWLTRSGLKRPCLEQIFMVLKMFKPLKFDCTFISADVFFFFSFLSKCMCCTSTVFDLILPHCALKFFKITEKTCGKIRIYLLKGTFHFENKKISKVLIWWCLGDFYLVFFIKAYVVGTHLNCIDFDAIQIGTHNICFYKEVDIKYTGCNLKPTKLLDCALIRGICGN